MALLPIIGTILAVEALTITLFSLFNLSQPEIARAPSILKSMSVYRI